MYKLPERRGGGGREVIWAMPERKHSFFQEVFPKVKFGLQRPLDKYFKRKLLPDNAVATIAAFLSTLW